MELDAETIEYAHRMFDLARSGHTEELAAQVGAGLPVNLTDARGNTLLILAAYHGCTGTVRALVRRGADVNRVNDHGQTALGSALFKQDADAVRVLLDAGADPDLGEQSARATAAFFGLAEMAELLPPASPLPPAPPPPAAPPTRPSDSAH